MSTCERCNSFGLNFKYPYPPNDFLMGKRNSKIWIVGLNPKEEKNYQGNETIFENENYFKTKHVHSYFGDFEKVSGVLYDFLGKEFGVAHTDLVKCPTKKFNNKDKDNKIDMNKIIDNCKGYLKQQFEQHHPDIIICNGAAVCKIVLEIIKPPDEYRTSYVGNLANHEISVVLSGFIRRIDNYAKRRLGKEIESIMKKYRMI
ncbi:MAG: uracil-DNA glycosylase family protein [Desulfobaccales bacterium]